MRNRLTTIMYVAITVTCAVCSDKAASASHLAAEKLTLHFVPGLHLNLSAMQRRNGCIRGQDAKSVFVTHEVEVDSATIAVVGVGNMPSAQHGRCTHSTNDAHLNCFLVQLEPTFIATQPCCTQPELE